MPPSLLLSLIFLLLLRLHLPMLLEQDASSFSWRFCKSQKDDGRSKLVVALIYCRFYGMCYWLRYVKLCLCCLCSIAVARPPFNSSKNKAKLTR